MRLTAPARVYLWDRAFSSSTLRSRAFTYHARPQYGMSVEKGPVPIQKNLIKVLGSALGYARATHIRRAIKELAVAGKTKSDGKGEVQRMVVLPP